MKTQQVILTTSVVAAADLTRRRFVGFGGNVCLPKGFGGELAFGKVAHRPSHAAKLERLQLVRIEVFAQNQLGGAPANVHHQAALVGLGQQSRHALVDQSGLFGAGNHINRISQHLTAA